MILRIVVLVAAIATLVVGIRYRVEPYHLLKVGFPADQQALDHRDSVYSHISWIASESGNYMDLRFFDNVEGSICLRPGWDSYARFSGLLHLVADANDSISPAQKHNPGTLTNSRYAVMLPLGVLLNARLLADAGGDTSQVKPRILVVGLGSGVGIAVYAHHFPQAEITVVDIDQVVIDMVRDHYPFLRWLEDQQTSTGRPRLRHVCMDARTLIRRAARHEQPPYDIVFLDAFASGSTIPAHLMTREFFAEVKQVLEPDGIVLSNIIGSYTGRRSKVLGGAIRSMRAGGLEHVINFPIHGIFDDGVVDTHRQRNNTVVASASPLAESEGAWELLRSFTPYAQFARRRYIQSHYFLLNGRQLASAKVPAAVLDATEQPLVVEKPGLNLPHLVRYLSDDSETISRARLLVNKAYSDRALLPGWADYFTDDVLCLELVDSVVMVRWIWSGAVRDASDPRHRGRQLVGPLEQERPDTEPDWIIREAPLFTDYQANADILNH